MIFCHLPSPWSACSLQLLSEVMPQSHWLHFYFHWEVKPKLLKLPAVVEGYWSLFWTRCVAVFHLSLTAAPEPQMLEVQEKGLLLTLSSQHSGLILSLLAIHDLYYTHWEYKNIPIWATAAWQCVYMGNCLGFKLGQILRPSSSKEMSRWARVQPLDLPRATGTPVKSLLSAGRCQFSL